MARFEIEDELHAEPQGEFDRRADALAELQRLAAVPWDSEPNQAPCQNWRNCGRKYELIEFDETVSPRKELHRELLLEISAAGVQWHRDGA
jgi:hypothetical protein